jgi:hypothetical protein
MSLVPVDAALAEFKPDDYTPRLVSGIFSVVPYSPTVTPYRVVEDAVKALKPDANAADFAKARMASTDRDLQDVLWMARLLDTGDKGYALFTGLSSVWGMVRGKGADALETDTQQRNDAALKALGMAYMAYNAFPGSMAERADAFGKSAAGQALLTYYAAVEIALPFADNAAVAGGNFFQQLVAKDAAPQLARLSQMSAGHSLEGAMGMLNAISGGVQRVVTHAVKYTGPITQTAQKYVPGAMGAADKMAGVVANAADVLPVYTYLGARLAAEGAAFRALK